MAGGLAGCQTAGPSLATPTLDAASVHPTPTLAPEERPAATPAPFTNATPPIVLVAPPPTPTPHAQPLPIPVPQEAIALLDPGPGSQVTSPIHISGFGGPSLNERLHLYLLGEDGQVISEHTTYLLSSPGKAGRFAWELPFQINGLAERGRLVATIESLRDGQLSHLASVPLVLLSTGDPLLRGAPRSSEKLTIASPRNNAVLHSGTVTITGGGWTENTVPLTIDVLDRTGTSIGSAQIVIDAPPGTSAMFQADVRFQVDHLQVGRVTVSEPSPDIPGMIHIAAVDVVLQP
jgi:hypothetical protein